MVIKKMGKRLRWIGERELHFLTDGNKEKRLDYKMKGGRELPFPTDANKEKYIW